MVVDPTQYQWLARKWKDRGNRRMLLAITNSFKRRKMDEMRNGA